MPGSVNAASDSCRPMNAKKNGGKNAYSGATSSSIGLWSFVSATIIPARNAPMIAARPICAESAASPRQMITAGSSGDSEKRGTCSSAGRACRSFVPPSAMNATNATATAAVIAIEPMSTPPSAATPAATATSSSARMSSTIAAPRIVRLARRSSTPSSISTADVMPTLVAVSAAPRNRAVAVVSPSATARPMPPANGIATPSSPTDVAVRPTSRRSDSRVSSPTQNSRKTTPSSAKTSSTSLGSTSPKTAGPTSTPARISPTIVGWRRRLKQLVAELRGEQDDEQVGQQLGDAG